MVDTGEYLAGNVSNDQLIHSANECLDRITKLETAIVAIVERTHRTYHDRSQSWMSCPNLTCRRAVTALAPSDPEHEGS
jgi:hypothetical protein